MNCSRLTIRLACLVVISILAVAPARSAMQDGSLEPPENIIIRNPVLCEEPRLENDCARNCRNCPSCQNCCNAFADFETFEHCLIRCSYSFSNCDPHHID